MGVLILVLFGLLALASANGCQSTLDSDGNFDFGTSGEASASDGLPTCDGVVVIDVASEPVRVPGDTDLFSSASPTCGMSVGRGDEDAVVVLQDALARCNGESVSVDGEYGPQTAAAVMDVQERAGITADGEYGPATLQAMRWPTTTTSGARTDCVAGASSAAAVESESSSSAGTQGGSSSSSLPPTD
ncbi:MAG: peptidoglycan-binding domain-containing protein [Acidimicrobiales bacterium]